MPRETRRKAGGERLLNGVYGVLVVENLTANFRSVDVCAAAYVFEF